VNDEKWDGIIIGKRKVKKVERDLSWPEARI
jgi:hypothetical protein